jgi:hypothetical protein
MVRFDGLGRTALPVNGTRRRSGMERPTREWCAPAVRDGAALPHDLAFSQ